MTTVEWNEKSKQIAKAATDLLASHGLSDWRFIWDRSRRRYGCCKYRYKRISISIYLAALNPIERTLQTVKHEIAHALAGSGAGHGPIWKRKAVEIGCPPVRCYDEAVIQPKAKYIGTCPNGHKLERNRLSRRIMACAICCREHAFGKFDTRFIYKWSRNV